jgi:hypothetical protein
MICQWEIEGPHVLDDPSYESFLVRHWANLKMLLQRLYSGPGAQIAVRLALPWVDDRVILYGGNEAKVAIQNFKMRIQNIDPELPAVLRALAYLEASCKRVGETFRTLVWNELCLKFATELREHLQANLGLTGPDGQAICERLSLQTAAGREKVEGVEARIARLTEAIQSLEQLERVEIGLPSLQRLYTRTAAKGREEK